MSFYTLVMANDDGREMRASWCQTHCTDIGRALNEASSSLVGSREVRSRRPRGDQGPMLSPRCIRGSSRTAGGSSINLSNWGPDPTLVAEQQR